MPKPDLRALSWVMFKTGTFTLGGGSAVTATLQREFVEDHHWLAQPEFALCYALGRITPGTNIFAFCSAAGYVMLRLRGALVCLLVASVPSSFAAWLITLAFIAVQDHPLARPALQGAIVASVGLTFASAWVIVQPYLGRPLRSVALVAAGFLIAQWLPPVWTLAVCAAIGWLWE